MRKIALLALFFAACGPCSKEDHRTVIAPDRTADGGPLPRTIAPFEVLLTHGDADTLDGKLVEMVAIVDDQAPPHAIVMGNPVLPLVDGAIPAATARASSGHRKVRLRGTVHGNGLGAKVAVDGVEEIAEPLRPATLAEVDARPLAFDDAHVVLEGTHVVGEEKTALDDVAWLSGCPRHEEGSRTRVRVEGWLFTNPHTGESGASGFGHTNGYRYAIVADRCTTPDR